MRQDLLQRYAPEFRRALANHRYERTPDGIYFPESKALVNGVFRTRVNDADERIDANVMVYEGLDDILKVYFKQQAQRTAFYVAPFSGNVDPAQTLTALTFVATQTEFTNYTQSARPSWASDAEASQAVANATTPALFTADTGGGTVWGAALVTVAAKSNTGGILVACSKFGASRALLAGDKLSVEYAIAAADGT